MLTPQEKEAIYKQYDYLSEDQLPALVLGIPRTLDLAYGEYKPYKVQSPWKPVKILHQTAGIACHHVYLDGILLTPREPEKVKLLTLEYLNRGCVGMWGLTLEEAVEFNQKLKDLFGVHCNETFQFLEEGIYPIDCTAKNLAKICSDQLPTDLDALLHFESDWDRFRGIVGRWKLFILGENCD